MTTKEKTKKRKKRKILLSSTWIYRLKVAILYSNENI